MSAKRNTEKDQHIDPVCNMVVSSDSEYKYHYADKHYYFCSKHCLNKFKERPEQYLHKETSPPLETHGGLTAYTCPMHPEVVQDHPGTCPRCGMALEPMGIPAAATQTEYTCPMHPEVVQDHPGTCPKCGMALEPMGVPAAATQTEYTCPMHPEVVQDHPGTCPKCGMALEPMGIPAAATQTEYTCPMHPEVVQDHPGTCPKCGMALEPVTFAVEEKNEELIDMSRRFWVCTVLA
ncbi:MAG: heavy metal-binding domain-containing protein, partial [Desulfobacterales bacterium]